MTYLVIISDMAYVRTVFPVEAKNEEEAKTKGISEFKPAAHEKVNVIQLWHK